MRLAQQKEEFGKRERGPLPSPLGGNSKDTGFFLVGYPKMLVLHFLIKGG